MKTPVWVWDKRKKSYVALPAPPQRIGDVWGYSHEQLMDTIGIYEFYESHRYLFRQPNFRLSSLLGVPLLLRQSSTKEKWYNKDKARITKVQR
jgi:hypothetical protein